MILCYKQIVPFFFYLSHLLVIDHKIFANLESSTICNVMVDRLTQYVGWFAIGSYCY